jgi:hypothetical protein
MRVNTSSESAPELRNRGAEAAFAEATVARVVGVIL